MSVEAKRGCGYRKVGGLYLVGKGKAVHCDRLPYELTICPTCSNGIKFSRGFTWLNGLEYFKKHYKCTEVAPSLCPICNPKDEKYGLMWVGGKYYTPASFIEEAKKLGVSKRIAHVPKDLVLGKTWVLFAHKEGLTRDSKEKGQILESVPAIFYIFKPQRVEKLITKKEASMKNIMSLKKRGIKPILVPENDTDHNPKKGG